MKNLFLLLLALVSIQYQSLGQSFLNGSFENNIGNGCEYNKDNTDFNSLISNVYGVGDAEELDLHTDSCYVNPQDSNWCVGLAKSSLGPVDAISLELSTSLAQDSLYELSFYAYGNNSFNPIIDSIEIQYNTTSDLSGGVKIGAVFADSMSWGQHILRFRPSMPNVSFISVKIQTGQASQTWVQVDNFTIIPINFASNVQDQSLVNQVTVFPNPSFGTINVDFKDLRGDYIRVFDTNGRIIHDESNINTSIYQMDLDAPPGFYIIEVSAEQQRRFIKIIKN